ncbi:hypothetical protein TRFO_05339 [Tritrichomonas foetus]|uniref:Intimal thickness related receptor IRP domain-containing protein n=1 Tax=Tritrichomonas foetus TaxID=1144522 RepID=A0A1J4KCC5_9EUKA|nr:hypothetical protein TRFO_05339 [Tritrichomonas foetus]|eukprot:OHT07109.1 hypothetical protein TRFO_05339 [Tritrichomonas foetus]
MLIFILVSLVTSLVGTESTNVSTILILPAFGFKKGSTFRFKITSALESRVIMFLLTIQRAHEVSESQVHQACFDTSIHISPINKTDMNKSKVYEWYEEVPQQGIYYPVFLNCLSNHTHLKVDYKYTNINYLIDYRNENITQTLLIFGSLNIFLSLIWIINTLVKRNFIIPIHLAFVILPSIRALICIIEASLWENKKITDDYPKYKENAIAFFSAAYFIIYMITTTLIFSGFCIFRKNLPKHEFFEIVFSTILSVGGFLFGLKASDARTALTAVAMTVFGFMYYLQVNANYLIIFLKILDAEISNELTAKRINLVQNFSVTTITIIAVATILHSTAAAVEAADVYQLGLFESFVFVLEFLQIVFFSLRKAYEGNIEDSKNQIITTDPIIINTPNQKFICVLQRTEEN